MKFNIKPLLEKYNKIISQEFDIEIDKLEIILNDIQKRLLFSVKDKKDDKKKISDNTCPYIFTKGANIGKICNANTKGKKYCSRHHKYEETGQKEINIPPKKPSIIKNNIILNRHKKLNKFYHADTNFVFSVEKDKKVIGKIIKNKIEKLEKNDIIICKKWGFIFEK